MPEHTLTVSEPGQSDDHSAGPVQPSKFSQAKIALISPPTFPMSISIVYVILILVSTPDSSGISQVGIHHISMDGAVKLKLY